MSAQLGDSGTEWFWRIVDADGLGDVPSDEGDALRLLCRRAAERDRLLEENAMLRRERNALSAFARDVLADFYDVDGGTLQSLGLEHGLLQEVAFDPSQHTDDEGACEPGDPFYLLTGLCAPRPTKTAIISGAPAALGTEARSAEVADD